MAIVIQRRHVIAASLAAAAVATYLIGDWIIVTDAERLRVVVDRVVAAASKADARGVMAEVAPDYSQDGVRHEALQAFVERFFDAYGPAHTRMRSFTANAEGLVGVAEVRVYSRVDKETPWGRRGVASHWRLSFIRYGERWTIERIAPVSMGMQRISSLKRLMRRVP